MNTPSKSKSGSGKSPDKTRTSDVQIDRQNAAETLIGFAEELELFHTSTDVPYAVLKVNGHREVWGLRSLTFRNWLVGRYYAITGRGAPAEALKTALGTLEAKARFEGLKREVQTRVASHEGNIYIDLGDEAWRVVEVDSAGWRIIDTSPVYFRRAPGVLALPDPLRAGSIEALRTFLNIRSEGDFVLMVCWLLACLRGNPPFPLLVLTGEQGSAKSTLAKILRQLVDPNEAPLRIMPKNERDLFISAGNGYLLAYDNLSGIQAGMSDLLCTLSTGGGFSTRQLYTDEGEAIFKAARPILLNGIDDIVRRPDLADRAIFVGLEPIPEEKRRAEKELWAAFDSVAPSVLGALLDGMVVGLKRQADVRLPRLPRMADFALWSTAVETAYWPSGAFWEAYEANRAQAIEEVIESDLVGAAVMKLLAKRPSWEGTATELLAALGNADRAAASSKDWPKDPRAVSAGLKRAATFLRKLGVQYHNGRQGRSGTRIIFLQKVGGKAQPREDETFASASSVASAEDKNCQIDQDIHELNPQTQIPRADTMADAKWAASDNIGDPNPLNYRNSDEADDADANFPGLEEAEGEAAGEWSGEL